MVKEAKPTVKVTHPQENRYIFNERIGKSQYYDRKVQDRFTGSTMKIVTDETWKNLNNSNA